MKERRPEIGDIVAVRWTDHFEFKGDDVPDVMEVITWGKYDIENEDGIGVVMCEVQTGGQDVERRMTTQFILRPNILEIRKI